MPTTSQTDSPTLVVPQPAETVTVTPNEETVTTTQTTETVVRDANDADVVTLTQVDTVISTIEKTDTIVIQSAGPQGAPGVAEEDVPYAKRIDWISDTVLYKGEAAVGAATSAAAWRLQRITIASDDDVTVEWADGEAAFTKVYDNRASYTYS